MPQACTLPHGLKAAVYVCVPARVYMKELELLQCFWPDQLRLLPAAHGLPPPGTHASAARQLRHLRLSSVAAAHLLPQMNHATSTDLAVARSATSSGSCTDRPGRSQAAAGHVAYSEDAAAASTESVAEAEGCCSFGSWPNAVASGSSADLAQMQTASPAHTAVLTAAPLLAAGCRQRFASARWACKVAAGVELPVCLQDILGAGRELQELSLAGFKCVHRAPVDGGVAPPSQLPACHSAQCRPRFRNRCGHHWMVCAAIKVRLVNSWRLA